MLGSRTKSDKAAPEGSWLTVRRSRLTRSAFFPEFFCVTDIAQLRTIVEGAFEERQTIGVSTHGEVRDAVENALDLLDSGIVRVAEKRNGSWAVNQWLKKAVLLFFRLNDMQVVQGPGGMAWW